MEPCSNPTEVANEEQNVSSFLMLPFSSSFSPSSWQLLPHRVHQERLNPAKKSSLLSVILNGIFRFCLLFTPMQVPAFGSGKRFPSVKSSSL